MMMKMKVKCIFNNFLKSKTEVIYIFTLLFLVVVVFLFVDIFI